MNARAQMIGSLTEAGRLKHARYSFKTFARFCALDERATTWAAAFGAAIVVLIGTPLSVVLNIWVDEAFTLHTTGAGPFVAWAQAITFEGQPPLYFVLESLWRELNETSIAFARFPSIVFAAAAVSAIVFAARRIAPRIPAVVVAAVTAINPIVIWAAVEMRVYSLLLLVGAVLAWAFVEGFLVERPTMRARMWYTAFAIVGLYTQYYVGFLLAAHLITLLVFRGRSLRSFIVTMALVTVAFAPFTPVAMMHVAGSGDFVTRATFIHAAHALMNAAFVFVLPHNAQWTGAVKYAGFGLALALVITLLIIGRPRCETRSENGVFLQWFVSLAIFSLVFSVTGLPSDPLRHVLVVAPLSLLSALLLVASLTQHRRIFGGVAVAAFAIFALTQLWSQYHQPMGKPGDWQRVASTLSADDAPIAVFPAELAFPLHWYLGRAAIPVPKPLPFTTDYVRSTTLRDPAEVSRVLDPVRARSARLWVVTSGQCSVIVPENYNYNCRYLEAYVNQHYRMDRSVVFRGTLARLYTRVPNLSSASRRPAHAR